MHFHIIYTETNMFLTKHPYVSWRDIQDAYPGCKTSLGPWNHEEVIVFLADDYPHISPPAGEQVLALLHSAEETKPVTFDGANNAV